MANTYYIMILDMRAEFKLSFVKGTIKEVKQFVSDYRFSFLSVGIMRLNMNSNQAGQARREAVNISDFDFMANYANSEEYPTQLDIIASPEVNSENETEPTQQQEVSAEITETKEVQTMNYKLTIVNEKTGKTQVQFSQDLHGLKGVAADHLTRFGCAVQAQITDSEGTRVYISD